MDLQDHAIYHVWIPFFLPPLKIEEFELTLKKNSRRVNDSRVCIFTANENNQVCDSHVIDERHVLDGSGETCDRGGHLQRLDALLHHVRYPGDEEAAGNRSRNLQQRVGQLKTSGIRDQLVVDVDQNPGLRRMVVSHPIYVFPSNSLTVHLLPCWPQRWHG